MEEEYSQSLSDQYSQSGSHSGGQVMEEELVISEIESQKYGNSAEMNFRDNDDQVIDQDSDDDSEDFEPEEYIEPGDADNDESESDEDITDQIDEINDWKWSLEETFEPPEIPNFRKGSLQSRLKVNAKPLDFLLLIFDKKLISDLVLWTNQYANQTSNSERRKKRIALWYNTDTAEMMGFIGILIAMSLVKRENIREYWTNSRLLCTPGIQELMEYSRFRQLYNNIVLRPIENSTDNSDMFKIKGIRDRIIANSRLFYSPERELSVDECMIPFSGRHRWKVFMKSKPVKYGFKSYILAEASTGYILNWDICTGDPRSSNEDESVTFKVVKKLCKPFSDLGHYIYMDRFYTGLRIFRYLAIKGFGACGTVMLGRLRLHKDIKAELGTFQYQDFDFYQLGNELLLTVWKDKNLVMVLSTIHSTTTIKYERMIKARDEQNIPLAESEKIKKPTTITEYGKYMGGVDRFDKMLYNYHFYHRNCRWYIRIFTHFLELSILNAYVIYQKHCLKYQKVPLTRYNFHEQLTKDLVHEFRVKKNISQSPQKQRSKGFEKSFFTYEQLFGKINSKECNFQSLPNNSKPDCTVCKLENKRAQCTVICKTHDAPVHVKCFEKHKELVKSQIKK